MEVMFTYCAGLDVHKRMIMASVLVCNANIKLASVASNVQGFSARAMLEAMIGGETDAEALAKLARGRLRTKLPQLQAALTGQVRSHHRFMWQELLAQLDSLNTRLATRDAELARLTAPHAALIQRLAAIPGVDRRTAEVILAEIGPHVTSFPTAQQLASWAGLWRLDAERLHNDHRLKASGSTPKSTPRSAGTTHTVAPPRGRSSTPGARV